MTVARSIVEAAVVVSVCGLLASGTPGVRASASRACKTACAEAADRCVAIRQQDRAAAVAACAGTGRTLARCRRRAKRRFVKERTTCRGKARHVCRRCCSRGGAAAECAVVPGPPPTTTTTTTPPGATTSTTLSPVPPEPCPTGVYRIVAAEQTFEMPAACRDGVKLSPSAAHAVRLRVLGADGLPEPRGVAEGRLDPAPAHPQGATLATAAAADADGRVALDVTDGRYRIRAHVDACDAMLAPRELPPVTVAGADVDLGDVPLEPVPLVRVYGTVSGAAAGVDVSVQATWTPAAHEEECSAAVVGMADGAGTRDYDLRVPAGPVVVTAVQRIADIPCAADSSVDGERGAFASRTLDLAGPTRIDLALVPSVPITGALVDPDGDAAVGTSVAAPSFTGVDFVGCPADQAGFRQEVVPGVTYTLVGASGFQFPALGLPLWPPQILRDDLTVTGALDVGALALRGGCHLRGQIAGLPAFSTIAVCESRTRTDGQCLPVCATVFPDLDGGFDVLVLPGL